MSAGLMSGYKRTEVGVVPTDWQVRSLGDLADIATGSTPPTSDASNYGDEYLFVSPGDLGAHKFVRNTEKGLSKKGYSISRHFPKHSVLFVCIGSTIGKCGIASKDLTSNQQINAVLPALSLSSSYLYYVLSQAGPRIRYQAGEQAVPMVNKTQFSETVLALPPTKMEQEAIAEALSDMDAFIESLEQLITKKRHIKQGAMQELLTGRKRLPGFTERWAEAWLGDLFAFKNGLNKGREYFGHGTPIVNYMDVFRSAVNLPQHLQGRVEVTWAELQNFDVKAGDVFFTRTSETIEEVGMASVVLGHPKDTVFSGFVLRGRPKDERLVDAYKAYCFQSREVREQITSKASYTTRALTNGKLLSSVRLRFPESKEQTAIATILSDMDAELAALEAKLTKTRQIKQGMMRELLTGRIRLV